MSSLYSGIIPIMKQAAIDAVNSTQPVQFVFGTVTSASPLKIQVTPKLTLGAANLVVVGSLCKQSYTTKLSGETGETELDINGSPVKHTHTVNDTVTITIDNSLKKGDSVIMARMQGGNKYIVLDKAVNA